MQLSTMKKPSHNGHAKSATRSERVTKGAAVTSPVRTILGDALSGLKQIDSGSVQGMRHLPSLLPPAVVRHED